MKIKDVMTEDVQYANPTTPVTQLAKLMLEYDCGSIPVFENNKPVGMVTDRDIVLRCIAAEKDPLVMTAEECMTPGIMCCSQEEDVKDVLSNMGENAVRRFAVLDEDKKPVGIVSIGDLSAACDDKSVCGKAMEKIHEAA